MRDSAIRFLGAIVFSLTLAAPVQADWWDSREKVEGRGEVQRQTRDITEIDGVELATVGTMFIEQGEELNLTVEAEENLLEYIRTDVHRKTLVIRTQRDVSLRPHKSIQYHLTVPRLEEVTISSSGDVVVGDWTAERLLINIESSGDLDWGAITCPRLETHLESSGDLTIERWEGERLRAYLGSSGDLKIHSGAAKEQDIEISSSGDYNASDLETKTAKVHVSSSGDAKVRVSEYLYARTSSSGDIIYYGRPEVEARSSSSGDITPGGR